MGSGLVGTKYGMCEDIAWKAVATNQCGQIPAINYAAALIRKTHSMLLLLVIMQLAPMMQHEWPGDNSSTTYR